MREIAAAGVVLLLVALVAAACATDAGAGPAVSEALRRDAKSYAEDYGVPLDEAIERLRDQDPVGELNAVLEEQEGDVFGRLWIEHEPEYRVVIAVTEDPRRIRRRYVEGGPLEDVVELQEVETTLQELTDAQAETMEMLREVGSRADLGTDVRENCISLYVADPAELQSRLEAAGLELPDAVCITPTGPYAEAPSLDPPPGVVFPRQHPPEGLRVEMSALLIGELIEEDGCLRVGDVGQSNLVIWPYDHTVTAGEDGRLAIRDGNGTVVARLGDVVRLGGGQVPTVENATPMEVPDHCGGPYWLAASEIEAVTLNELPDHEDIAPLLAALRRCGQTLEGPEGSQAALLAPEPGIAYRLGERSWLHFHVFPDEQLAQVRADRIPHEMSNTIVDWVAPPHFYRCGRVIALYLGTDGDVEAVLNQGCVAIADA
ncbi:MAG: hypothetical protein U9R72_12775 [Chloroflexota bacterium]|nr:hypothetical protein [Chloroflexota bacterium]